MLSMFLGIGALGMFVLASALNLSIGWTIDMVMLVFLFLSSDFCSLTGMLEVTTVATLHSLWASLE